MLRICRKCGEKKDENGFYKSFTSWCKQCCRVYNRNRSRKYRKDPKHRQRLLDNYNRWYERNGRRRTRKQLDYSIEWSRDNKEKISAQTRLSYATRTKKIKRPSKCEICKQKKKIYGHHEDYKKPYEVVWVCSSCHKRIHSGEFTVKIRIT